MGLDVATFLFPGLTGCNVRKPIDCATILIPCYTGRMAGQKCYWTRSISPFLIEISFGLIGERGGKSK